MPSDLFDRRLRALRRDRAARLGPEMFLFDRAFDDCLDRLRDVRRRFERALLIGCPSPSWPERLQEFAENVDVADPGERFAASAGGVRVEEDRHDFGVDRYDLCVAIGTLDSVNDLPLALRLLDRALGPEGALIGAIAGGNSLPALRSALIEAGRSSGRVVARTHPRIDAAMLAQLLASSGFSMPVVDVDRVALRYAGLDALIRDLRKMGATSALASRSPPMTRAELEWARRSFEAAADEGRTTETVEILHFLAWAK